MNRRADAIEAAYECIPNISARGRRRRTVGAAVLLLTGIAATAVMAASGASASSRLLLALPFFGAAFGWFQAREKT
ncbi:MAG: hypothetical protein ABSG61_00320 [Gemmatimonadales bacterium]